MATNPEDSETENPSISRKSPARFSRCLQLLNLLHSRIGYSLPCLANEFEVSQRTILRDLRFLTEAGVSVCCDTAKGGYVLLSGYNIRTMKLSHDEVLSLLLAAHIQSFASLQDDARLLHQAIAKLLSQLSEKPREEITNLLGSITSESHPQLWPRGDQAAVAEIMAAISRKRPIRVVYHPAEDSTASLRTKITSHRLVAAEGRWFLVGRSSWHRKVFRFDLQHIRHAEQVEDTSNLVESPPKPLGQSTPAAKRRRVPTP